MFINHDKILKEDDRYSMVSRLLDGEDYPVRKKLKLGAKWGAGGGGSLSFLANRKFAVQSTARRNRTCIKCPTATLKHT